MSDTAYSSEHARPLPEGGMGDARDFFELLKPRVMSLVIFTALVGIAVAPGGIHPVIAFTALLCIAVGAGASGALNMWYDADIDAKMARTANRPIPAGRVTPSEAAGFGAILSVFSVMTMGVLVNWVAASLLAFTIFFYLVIYTMWLKRRTPQNIVIGGASGAFPPMIGWAAVTGDIGLGAIALFTIIFLWTPPHSWALALFRRGDYAAADVPMMPVVAGERETKRQILVYTVLLIASTLSPVAVGMSGGVDSAVAALLLKRRGHDVVGVHMRNWDAAEEGSEEAGYAEQEQKDARRVCDTLGIGYREVDLSREYWHEVFEPFVRGYSEGRTPNPDVACNRHIKFDHFARATRALGADGVATGHYARLRRREPGGAVELLTGADETKDQSYFLAAVEQSALRDALFPLGELRKTEVRALAAEAGLHVAAKRDSAGICFVGRRNFASFLANYVPAQPSGPFVCVDRGAAVGEHRGQAFYTPGQRARIGGQPRPWYVVAKDAETNTVFVCDGAAHPALLTQALLAAPKGADAGSLDRPETTFGRGSARERSGMGCSS